MGYTVSAADLADVRATLKSIGDEAGRMVYEAAMLLDYSDVASAREQAIEIMDQVLGPMTDLAAQAAVDWYNLGREAATGRAYSAAIADSRRIPEATEGAVRAFIQAVVEGKPVEKFAERLRGRATYEVQKAFADCVSFNGRIDPQKPRWARVTQGHSCKFCLMLASRGFVYHSQSTAVDHYHDHCDCIATPGFPGTEVEGYDTRELMRQYTAFVAEDAKRWSQNATVNRKRKMEAFASVPAAAAALKGAESVEELQELVDKVYAWVSYKYRDNPQKLSRHLTSLRQATMGRMDVLAARNAEEMGVAAGASSEHPVDYSENPRETYGRLLKKSYRFNPDDYREENIVDRGNEWRDLFAHDLLSSNGFDLVARPADAPKGFSNIDLEIDGQLWEVKSPFTRSRDLEFASDDELSFIATNLGKANRQFGHQYDSETGGRLSYSGKVRVVLNLRYKDISSTRKEVMARVSEDMRRKHVDEVIILWRDGGPDDLISRLNS